MYVCFIRMDFSSGITHRSNVCHIKFHQKNFADIDKGCHILFHFLLHIQQLDISQNIDFTEFSFLHL